MYAVKTTFDLPDALYRRVKVHAAQRGLTVRELVIESLQYRLELETNAGITGETRKAPASGHSEVDEHGWPVLKRRADDSTAVTEELVNALREQERV